MASHSTGRHRAPGRFNPVSELSGIVASAAQPAVKTSAVIAASGGLVASFALPASAASASPAPAAAKRTAATVAPVAVRAPETAAPAASSAFGVIGFTATAKPKPKPVVHHVATTGRSSASTASRSTARKDYTSLKPAAGGVLAIAAQYEGLMYSYGGTSPSTGFDCSGFTQYVFGKVGISLPRTAEEQKQVTDRVSNPQPGDLVFFGSPAYHVGIYAGNGMMWDSPRSGKAVALRSIWSSNVTYGRP
ncbi:Cell wall-associated hydrolase, NlpC family [Pedococcus dokdonensis]|uniref:Cell wall-associated hydrolase, NlpC family n=1 Tax=Pedococcus dokdonensis TaxID=443156 RepID=A0A1H0SJ29_9MICO|nr:C40 family peptidase [Pedococcus dokdonensis]SDP41791.1 Cell wall-associated hydrolase, NlpC family [Pedococcus dokdonensis]